MYLSLRCVCVAKIPALFAFVTGQAIPGRDSHFHFVEENFRILTNPAIIDSVLESWRQTTSAAEPSRRLNTTRFCPPKLGEALLLVAVVDRALAGCV